MFVSFRVFFSFRTSPSTHPRPPSHLSFRPRPQRGEYRIMGLEISDAFLGTTARPRSRARVFFCHIENKVVLEVVIDF